ncbi:hypothetical protein DVH24_004052 [Malus domestica]|uniref:Cation/H+ exchanger domain-containing protein n=1 Tax=Malus domestica TaxID=3750 RepID=A0A498K578_MALDO|nr:hypothetical protein DVH24_004052 [Malus domestica]
MSFIAETFIFLYVGMDALDIEKWKLTKLSYRFTKFCIHRIIQLWVPFLFLRLRGFFSYLLILIGRAAFVFPLSALSNFTNRRAERSASISFKNQYLS